MLKSLAAVSIALLLAGCADTGAMRGLASQISTRVAQDQADLDAFVADQNTFNESIAAGVIRDQQIRARVESETAMRRDEWTYGDRKGLLDKQAWSARSDASSILAAMSATAAPPPKVDAEDTSKKLAQIHDQLAKLATKPKTKDQLKELYAEGNAVYSAVQDLKKSAAAAAPSAAPTKPATP
jgi:outer membrane murein-binding lipoprotein Lpp